MLRGCGQDTKGCGQDTKVSCYLEGLLLHFHSIAMLFSVWYPDQQQQPLGTCLEMQFIWPRPRPLESETLGVRPNCVDFNKPSKGFRHMLQVETLHATTSQGN